MITTLIIFGVILSVISIIVGYDRLQVKNRKTISQNWEVGDVIIPDWNYLGNELTKELKGRNLNTLTLSGWNSENIFYNLGGSCYCESWSSIKSNKSQIWRDNHKNCSEFMGKQPGFDSKVSESNSFSSETIDGLPIELMNETLCQVHLAKAIEDENYELADKLRKRLEKFR